MPDAPRSFPAALRALKSEFPHNSRIIDTIADLVDREYDFNVPGEYNQALRKTFEAIVVARDLHPTERN